LPSGGKAFWVFATPKRPKEKQNRKKRNDRKRENHIENPVINGGVSERAPGSQRREKRQKIHLRGKRRSGGGDNDRTNFDGTKLPPTKVRAKKAKGDPRGREGGANLHGHHFRGRELGQGGGRGGICGWGKEGWLKLTPPNPSHRCDHSGHRELRAKGRRRGGALRGKEKAVSMHLGGV